MDILEITKDVEEFIGGKERLLRHIERIKGSLSETRTKSKKFYDAYLNATDGKNDIYLHFHREYEEQLRISIKTLAELEDAVLGLERRIGQLRS